MSGPPGAPGDRDLGNPFAHLRLDLVPTVAGGCHALARRGSQARPSLAAPVNGPPLNLPLTAQADVEACRRLRRRRKTRDRQRLRGRTTGALSAPHMAERLRGGTRTFHGRLRKGDSSYRGAALRSARGNLTAARMFLTVAGATREHQTLAGEPTEFQRCLGNVSRPTTNARNSGRWPRTRRSVSLRAGSVKSYLLVKERDRRRLPELAGEAAIASQSLGNTTWFLLEINGNSGK